MLLLARAHTHLPIDLSSFPASVCFVLERLRVYKITRSRRKQNIVKLFWDKENKETKETKCDYERVPGAIVERFESTTSDQWSVADKETLLALGTHYDQSLWLSLHSRPRLFCVRSLTEHLTILHNLCGSIFTSLFCLFQSD